MYAALTPLVGALLTVMNIVNSLFAARVGSWTSTLVIHLTGLAAASVALLLKREKREGGHVPLWAWSGGFVGVGVVLACNYAFQALDASLAVAIGLLGQIIASLTMDATGFLGRLKAPVRARSLPGIAIVAAGVSVMALYGQSAHANGGAPFALATLVAFASGALPVLSIAINSELGKMRGVLTSARANYIVGLATTLVLVILVRPSFAAAPAAVLGAGPVLALGGGLIGLAVVVAMNIIFPRVKAFTAALLMFGGQAFAGLAVDFARTGMVALPSLAGSALVMAGLAVKGWLEKKK